MADRLFGTDGIRGIAGAYPLEPSTLGRIGAALIRAMGGPEGAPRLFVGRDTRESGAWIERELARGVRAEGSEIVSGGVLPTPTIAYLTRAKKFSAGVVISASHNPYQDNGIKIFSGRGEKFTDHLEIEIERIIGDRSWQVPETSAGSVDYQDLSDAYVKHALSALPRPERLAGRRILLDCANGSTVFLAPRVFQTLGFDVHVINGAPDGRNINLNGGSTQPERLAQMVRDDAYVLGVAFDGDGDRAILVDHRGEIVNGDAILLVLARHLKATGRLRNNAVVATVMSNLGLEMALRDEGIELIRCPVGDKYVMEAMVRRNLSLGGEQSGHVIISERLFTGDGIVTALSVLEAMAETGRELADLASGLTVFPQVLMNVPVRQKRDLQKVPPVADAVARVERQMAGRGRLLVRYSGTEPLLRVMVEGRDEQQISAWAQEIVEQVTKHLG